MKTSIVCTFIGSDKPGLVELLAKTISESEGNWLESSMAQLAGQFAGIVRVELPKQRSAELQEKLSALEPRGLSVQVIENTEQDNNNNNIVKSEHRPGLLLNIVGNDRPGIVHEVSQALSSAGVNVIRMDTHLSSAAMSGDQLFHSSMVLANSSETDLDSLESRLELIAGELSIEIDVEVEVDGGS